MREVSSARDPEGPVVIVDPYSSGAMLAPAFLARGVEVIAVRTAPTPPDVYADSYRPGDFATSYVADADLDSLVAILRELRPRCILAGCESGVELAEQLAPRVTPEVANVAELAAARRHKGEMAAAVRWAGVPGIEQICTNDPAEVRAWLHATGLAGHDLVIKPPKSASTDLVTRVPGGAGWEQLFRSMVGATNRLGLVNDTVVVQEYVAGNEYVVDTFSHDGIHTVTDVCRYAKIVNDGHMAVYDTMEWLAPDEEVVQPLVAYARSVLDAVGMRFGAAHVEIMLTAQGPKLIEIGARAHGGGQPRFCLHATGDSQIERTVRYFTGAGGIEQSYTLQAHTMVVFHVARHDGVVADTAPLDRIPALPTYLTGVHHLVTGEPVSATKDLFASLDLGFVVLSGPDRDLLYRDYLTIRQLETLVLVAAGEPVMAGTR